MTEGLGDPPRYVLQVQFAGTQTRSAAPDSARFLAARRRIEDLAATPCRLEQCRSDNTINSITWCSVHVHVLFYKKYMAQLQFFGTFCVFVFFKK